MANESLPKEDQIVISDEVTAIIAGIAANKVDGIASMSGGVVGNLAERLGAKKDLARGVKVESTNEEASIELNLIVDYGIKIHETCGVVQERVREAVQEMTGLAVPGVSVNVQGVNLDEQIELENTD
ncbi:Asp23/Gls24 family envelope stress response protein [Natranaerobius thermophilus]|uniref:Asp23/Gls24 family envelope stress response protein n=1 Tax=Natranaerobius thermophilus (strain ATCC BAA-1301 / DSM 18059 / JW/NM-WN-LF) TaxID=457570 RepID=B2A5H8_NATTJ|nr:Asp23/Gls24 family envelope stress response protein [Natranaerobius thermophilus]ACB85333.1 protein of unknown function DUF322 [Natranaerobius thermophilus JW/NM-WN-LF]